MKEYFVLSDIHSFYDEMMVALLDKGFSQENPDHIIIVCGDIMDRGSQSKQVLDFLYDLYKLDRVILIRGNHEDLFEDMLDRGYYGKHDISNGTFRTLKDLQPNDVDDKLARILFHELLTNYDRRWDELRSIMVPYYELGKYIFVHAWIPFKYNDTGKFSMLAYYGNSPKTSLYDPGWRNASEFSFQEARWVNGMEYADAGIIEPGKTIVCGHWHCSYGNARKKYPGKTYGFYREKEYDTTEMDLFEPYYGDGIIAIDACTALTKKCNCLHLKESDIYEKED